MVSTVSLTVKKQLEDKWAAAFYECGIPLEVASSQALCDAAEDTARLVRMPDHRFALVLTGFGAGKVGARRLHEPKPETDLVAISSTMRTRASKSASKVRCTYSLSWQDRHARIRWAQALCQAADVESPRAHVDGCLSHRNLRHLPLEKDADACLVGRLGRGQEGATRFCCSCHKPADLHRRSRAMLEGVRAHSLRVSKADSEPVALGRSGLRNWSECTITFVCAAVSLRSSPEYGDVHSCICPQ